MPEDAHAAVDRLQSHVQDPLASELVKQRFQAQYAFLATLDPAHPVVAQKLEDLEQLVRSDAETLAPLAAFNPHNFLTILKIRSEQPQSRLERSLAMHLLLRHVDAYLARPEVASAMHGFPSKLAYPLENYATAKAVVQSKRYGAAVAVGAEGFAYASLFDLFGMPVLKVFVDEHAGESRPYHRIDDLSDIRGKDIMIIEDDVRTGKTLRTVLKHVNGEHPASISLYLGLPEGRQNRKSIPKTVQDIMMAPNILSETEERAAVSDLLYTSSAGQALFRR